MCNYLANQGHCVQTPPLPTAFPNRLLWNKGRTWIRSGQGPLSPCCKAHTPSESIQSQRKTWMRQIFDWDLGVCSPDKLYSPPFSIPLLTHQFSRSPQAFHRNVVTYFLVPRSPQPALKHSQTAIPSLQIPCQHIPANSDHFRANQG